jgi:hypothetical protein
VEHDDPAVRAPVLQAIKELVRKSIELRDECEVLQAETQWGWGSENRRRAVKPTARRQRK